MEGVKMKKRILIISIFLVCLVVPSVLVIAQNSNQTEKSSTSNKPMTKRERQIEEIVRDARKKRLEQKKDVFIKRNIDVNSITPRKIEELLDSNALTIDDVENMFPKEKLYKLPALKLLAKTTVEKETSTEQANTFIIFCIESLLHELKYYMEFPTPKINLPSS